MATGAQIIPKDGLPELDHLVRRFDRDKPVLMTVKMNEQYDVDAMQVYLETLTRLPRFKLVAFLDEGGRFIACASASGFYGLIRNYQLAGEFLNAIQVGNEDNVFQYPGILKNVITADATNAEALAAMDQYGLDALAVIGEDRRVKGVVEREKLMIKLVLSLSDDAAENRR